MDKQLLKQIINRYEATSFIVHRRLNAMLKGTLGEGLTADQYSTIRYIRLRGSCTSSELSEIFCVGKSSITAIIIRLFDKDLIKRIPDEKDRRVTYISLTDKGAALTVRMEEKIQEMLGSLIENFDDQEAVTFIESYEKLAQVLVLADEGSRKHE